MVAGLLLYVAVAQETCATIRYNHIMDNKK